MRIELHEDRAGRAWLVSGDRAYEPPRALGEADASRHLRLSALALTLVPAESLPALSTDASNLGLGADTLLSVWESDERGQTVTRTGHEARGTRAAELLSGEPQGALYVT